MSRPLFLVKYYEIHDFCCVSSQLYADCGGDETAFSLRQTRQNHEVHTIFTTQPAAAPVPSLKLTNSLVPQNGWNWNTFIVSFLKLPARGLFSGRLLRSFQGAEFTPGELCGLSETTSRAS